MNRTEELLAHVELDRLQRRYADVVDRRAWPELGELFAPDSLVRIDTVTRPAVELVGPAALGEFIGAAVERFAFFEFVLLNSRIDIDHPTSARARIFMCEVRRDVATLEWSVAYGVYHDRYRRDGDRWRFSRRDYQTLTRTGGDVFPFPHHLGGPDGPSGA